MPGILATLKLCEAGSPGKPMGLAYPILQLRESGLRPGPSRRAAGRFCGKQPATRGSKNFWTHGDASNGGMASMGYLR